MGLTAGGLRFESGFVHFLVCSPDDRSIISGLVDGCRLLQELYLILALHYYTPPSSGYRVGLGRLLINHEFIAFSCGLHGDNVLY
jgi:hypothetical protein